MNVAQVMKKSIDILSELDNIQLHLRPELEDNWDSGYALVNGLYYDEFNDYFDHERFRENYERKVKSLFPGCMVNFMWNTQELEVIK